MHMQSYEAKSIYLQSLFSKVQNLQNFEIQLGKLAILFFRLQRINFMYILRFRQPEYECRQL